MIYDFEIVKSAILKSLRLLIQCDQYIIENALREECINHRFANHLESVFEPIMPEYFTVDIEYDKSLKGLKEIYDESGKVLGIRPDITIHERNTHNHNLIAIEAKKGYMTKHDRKKIKALLSAPYKYSLGCFVSYLPKSNHMAVIIINRPNVEAYHIRKNGCIIEENEELTNKYAAYFA